MGFKDRFKDIKPASDILIDTVEEQKETPNFPIFDSVKRKLSDKISNIPVWFEYSEEEKSELTSTFLDTYLKDSDMTLTADEKSELVTLLTKTVYGFGELDLLLSDNSISSVTVKNCKPVLIERNGVTSESELFIEKTTLLSDKLIKLSGVKPDKSVIKFTYKNLIITMILPPVSDIYIYIKKKNRESTDFEYLLQNNKIDENIYSYLISLINDKKSILISGSPNSGKTSYLEAFLSAISNYTLLQENCFINRESFICGGLDEDELENIIDIVTADNSDYAVYDLNNGLFANSEKAIISTLRADSQIYAITKLSGNEAAKRKLTEKQAKAKIASSFDYIIQLDNDLFISSIAEFSLNKAGSLVMTEILKRDGQKYVF